MTRVYAVLLLLHLALVVVALIDCVGADERSIRRLSRTAWLFLILFAPPIGAIAWFVAGQPVPVVRLSDGRVLRSGRDERVDAMPLTARPVPVFAGPEDDPDFVRSLAAEVERRRAQES